MNNLSAEWFGAVSGAVSWQRIDFGEKERLLDAEWFVRKQDCGVRGVYGVASVCGLKGLLYGLLIFNRAAVTENRGPGGRFWCADPVFSRWFSCFPAPVFCDVALLI